MQWIALLLIHAGVAINVKQKERSNVYVHT